MSTTELSSAELTISPLSGFTGALIEGVDLSAPLSAEQLAAIRAALHRWKVVFFRAQDLDHASQIAFGAQFGEVTPGHPYEGDSAPAGFPQIHTVSPAAYDHRYGTRYRKRQSPNGPGWHADVTPLINPPSHSILRAEHVPEYGGDTQFTNVAAVYAGLSPAVQALIGELRAEHRFGATTLAERSAEKIGDLVRSNPLATIHPVVRVHPETGERVLYVNPSFTREIVNLSPRESRHLLDLLFEEIARPEYSVRFKWEPGSVAFWDNRAALHLAPRDFEHVEGDRVLHRITLVGDIPVGPDGVASESISGDYFGAA
ncbi:TauD/TfdA dioxygenase family protein [Mycolicibacterium neworleansense]|uniref:Putative taurine dioxygenase n=1 Tax=Mycolicibacterium neworleansense TaxID=146018 RepID=A0A0H5RZT2_9MYCO|nr:TauD/TfdA family dioxygenase [Mycolicibacterium neworleansense]MCV7360997.1 TauD/TfdA family dioxygenase [Mycolicibacterium neworleansense]CRZ14234.1 putative taurine dioxygenase [Mycolicibacterium neworleansense]